MKLAIFFRRPMRRRPAQRRPDTIKPDWTARQWADLPPYHPPQD
jgi:hypothetical protein